MTTPSEEARASLDAAVEEALDSYATDMVLIWSRESDEAKTERDAMERELLKVKQELRALLAKPKAHDCVCAECERKNELLKRDPLVLEVIAAHAACSAMASPWSPSERAQRQRQEAGLRLKAALDKLAEFRT